MATKEQIERAAEILSAELSDEEALSTDRFVSRFEYAANAVYAISCWLEANGDVKSAGVLAQAAEQVALIEASQ